MSITTLKPLILASGSVSRKALLDRAQLEFQIIPADIDEAALQQSMLNATPKEKALALAKAKALVISEQHPDAYVIGGDQICSFGDLILDKPGNTQTAEQHLMMLAGKTHHQFSAVCITKNGECLWSLVDAAALTMKPLSDDEISAYVHKDNPIASCGAYKFESAGGALFSDVQGSADTIIGMPLLPVLQALKEFGVYSAA